MSPRLLKALPWLAALSAMAAIAGSLFDVRALVLIFKPATTLLVIAWAWPRGADTPAVRRWVLAGLLLSLVGDVCLMWPREGFLPGLVAFLLAHLAYIVAFTRTLRLGARPLPFFAYALVAAVILWQLWPGVPAPLRLPVLAYVVCLASMAAQAAALWLAARAGPAAPAARRAAVGGMLFMTSDALLAFDKFGGAPLPAAGLWILLTYWLAQGAIAASLRAPSPGR